MKCSAFLSSVGLAVVIGSLAFAQPAKDSKPAATPPAKDKMPAGMPPGMTEEDMKDMATCMEAGKPGPMQAYLAENVGVWTGKNTMWMKPGAEPMKSECTATYTSVMDGRYVKCEVVGDMGGMAFLGSGVYGYDNVGKKFQSTWIDNCGSGIMTGTGERSSDGKTLTWTYSYNCPVAKKLVTMREVETRTGKDSMKLEMYGPDKAGKEFKMMEIAYTRKASANADMAK